MRLPKALTNHLFAALYYRVVRKRRPDYVIGSAADPYLLRWWVIPRNGLFNIYLHEFHRSDDDRALHDHPWFNVSLLLAGSYVEHTIAPGGINRRTSRSAGALKFRTPKSAHRIELTHGNCWTLFITGPRLRQWGFHCPNGWVHWRKFTDPTDSGLVGPGCGEAD